MLELLPGYVIDTCALVDLWRRQYPPDVFQTLWGNLESMTGDGSVIAPKEVLDELAAHDDDLLKWAKRQGRMFVELDGNIALMLKKVVTENRGIVDALKEKAQADAVVVALALATGRSVVTSEKPGSSVARPKIPDVCHTYGVECFSLLEFFRRMGWKF